MTLESSGTMSIGGSTSGRSINLELGRSATATSNLNESDLRTLAEVSSGAISISDFYGKSDLVPVSVEYFYSNGTHSLAVPSTVTMFKIAGVASGASGSNTSPGSTVNGKHGGGGGAGNVSGYTTPNASVAGQTVYIGANGNVYVKTGSHSGPDIWHAGSGTITAGGSMITGPGNSGGNGGSGGPRHQTGGTGGSVTNAAAGGGGGGGHGDGQGDPGFPGGPGGSVTISNAITPLGVGPAPAWTITGGGGGNGGPRKQGGGTGGGGAGGGQGGSHWPDSGANGGGGGGGGSVIVNGTGYGGGGGGAGANHSSGSGRGGGTGRNQFIIVQMTYLG